MDARELSLRVKSPYITKSSVFRAHGVTNILEFLMVSSVDWIFKSTIFPRNIHAETGPRSYKSNRESFKMKPKKGTSGMNSGCGLEYAIGTSIFWRFSSCGWRILRLQLWQLRVEQMLFLLIEFSSNQMKACELQQTKTSCTHRSVALIKKNTVSLKDAKKSASFFECLFPEFSSRQLGHSPPGGFIINYLDSNKI